MADIASFTDVDVATGQLEGRVGTHPFDLLDSVLEVEQGRHLHDTADADHYERECQQEGGVAFDDAVLAQYVHGTLLFGRLHDG